jgi:hypothetical protein
MSLYHQNFTPRNLSMKMSYPSSQLHISKFWIEYFTYVKVLILSQGNIQVMIKTWLKNESIIAKHGMMPIIRNSSFGVQNPKIRNFVYIFIGLPRQRLVL